MPVRRRGPLRPTRRRAQWKATTPQLVSITVDESVYQVPQRPVKAYERGLPRPEG
ncbi:MULTISPECIES: 50S ribosomal protein L32 [unclassified Streptomyces]|uniref:50S ribosomal protein L32 n=1 Tax=unclassified Streptomyces TaxID=2593676 RepID=UPI003869A153